MSHWAAAYIGLPWQNGAQGPDAFDCWALVRHVQHRHFGRELPIIDVDADDAQAVEQAFTGHEERDRWAQVEMPQDGDCVLTRKGRHPDHVGVWLDIDGGRVLHAIRGTGVVATSLQALRRMGWNPEFYRFKGDAA